MKMLGKLASAIATLCAAFSMAQSSLAASQSAASAAVPPPEGISELYTQLSKQASGTPQVSIKKATGVASMVRVSAGGDLLPGIRSSSTASKAASFFHGYGKLFGIADADAELLPIEISQEQSGGSHITYRQVYQGVPVFGGMLVAHFDAGGALTSVSGIAAPTAALDVTPRLSAAQAGASAVRQVLADPPADSVGQPAKVQPADLWPSAADLYVYRTGLVRNVTGSNQLAYEVTVTNGSSIRERVYVHAHSGKVLNRYTDIENGLHRVLYEEDTDHQVWEEGQPFPGALNQDQQNIINASGDSYYFFLNAFGRDSYDAQGAFMRTVNNDPTIDCPNANWNGATTNYCNGVTADDVVAHEWGHAFTEYTHGLVYQWQPGALNEAYSDIWGETVDLLNGTGTDAPAVARADTTCSDYSSIDTPLVKITAPASIVGQCIGAVSNFGPNITTTGIAGTVVLGEDGVGGTGCAALTNASAVSGKIALLNDSTACSSYAKVEAAQDAGAIAVIVVSATASVNSMTSSVQDLTIPSIRIAKANGELIKNTIAAGETVTVELKREALFTSAASYRWLMGEDATAFGGAIRDMWNPSCLGDPDRVSDAVYYCGTGDNGGVHTNSAVPNHAYALLVDGGTFNGQTVTGLGLVKAAHIYWQAQATYQTPLTDFVDHADALEQSCQDLIGQPLKSLSTSSSGSSVSSEVISSADCGQVTKVVSAVELRTDPVQCNFQPLLNKNTPSLCSDTDDLYQEVFAEDFESGLDGWTQTNQGVYSGWKDANWQVDTSLPGGRTGAGVYAVGVDDGNCDAGAGDISGVQMLTSPDIVISAVGAPKLSFVHYVASEASYDGGNVKISINGGDFTVLPASAFTFNGYNRMLATIDDQNTNPLAGQEAFSGTDGGKAEGSWGQSLVDLSKAGVKVGDTIRLRFDFGNDGCGGIDGWYVDQIQVYVCIGQVFLPAIYRD